MLLQLNTINFRKVFSYSRQTFLKFAGKSDIGNTQPDIRYLIQSNSITPDKFLRRRFIINDVKSQLTNCRLTIGNLRLNKATIANHQ